MALNDAATLSIGTAHFYTGVTDLAFPVSRAALLALTTTPGSWSQIGHTSLEDIIAFTSEGGEATTLGTLQSPTLRTKYSARTESFTINVQQWDEDSQKLYFGSNMAEVSADAIFAGVPSAPTVTTKAFLAVIQDSGYVTALYAPKAEIFRGDDIDFSDTESFASLPLSVKPLVSGSNTWAYALTVPLAA